MVGLRLGLENCKTIFHFRYFEKDLQGQGSRVLSLLLEAINYGRLIEATLYVSRLDLGAANDPCHIKAEDIEKYSNSKYYI